MEEEDRNKILQNLTKLVEGISFNDLFNQLRKCSMFNKYMENEIMSVEESNKLKFLYWYVTTRGPSAFNQLVEALKKINRNDLAVLLTSPRISRTQPFKNGDSPDQPSLEEEFPYEEEWTVIQADPVRDIFDNNTGKVYKMRSSPRGLALIINIRKFVNDTMPERLGSEKDVARLSNILPQLGYEVFVEEDLTANEMRTKISEFSELKKHWKCDSLMVFVMSHGKEQSDGSKTVLIPGTDLQNVNWWDIVYQFSARRCEALSGKPKMFFFQSCRGKNFNYSVRKKVQNGEEEISSEVEVGSQNGHSMDVPMEGAMQTDGVFMGKTDVVRSDSDIIIGHATSPGMYSFRNEVDGSWYIQTLCRVLARDAWHEDLQTMLQTVKRERNRLELNDILIDESNQGFNKLLYFHPGIHFDPSLTKTLNGS